MIILQRFSTPVMLDIKNILCTIKFRAFFAREVEKDITEIYRYWYLLIQ